VAEIVLKKNYAGRKGVRKVIVCQRKQPSRGKRGTRAKESRHDPDGEFVREVFHHIREAKHGRGRATTSHRHWCQRERRAGGKNTAAKGPEKFRISAPQDARVIIKKDKTLAQKGRLVRRSRDRITSGFGP